MPVSGQEAVAKLGSGEAEVDLGNQDLSDDTAAALGVDGLATNTVVIKLDLTGTPHPRPTTPTHRSCGFRIGSAHASARRQSNRGQRGSGAQHGAEDEYDAAAAGPPMCGPPSALSSVRHALVVMDAIMG